MLDCEICGKKHQENPEICSKASEKTVQTALSATIEHLLKVVGDTPAIRLMIANYTIGYTGASYGINRLYIPR